MQLRGHSRIGGCGKPFPPQLLCLLGVARLVEHGTQAPARLDAVITLREPLDEGRQQAERVLRVARLEVGSSRLEQPATPSGDSSSGVSRPASS